MSDKTITEKLKILHNKFVVVQIDMNSGNVTFVCHIISTQTKTIKPLHKVVSDDTSFLKSRFNLEVNVDLQKLYRPFYGWGSTVSRLQSRYEETVYFLPFIRQELLVLY